jgi:hypothetical protein
MTDIIKFVALFIFCNGAGCNCSNNPNGGHFDEFQLWLGLFVYLIAAVIERIEIRNDKD